MRYLVCLLLFIFVFVAKAQDKTTLDLEKIDRYLAKTQKEWNVPGMSVGIIQDGKLVFSKGYGQKEVGKPEQPDANTLYAIASNSKAFTSALMAMYVQEGKLKWTDKVVDYLPYFRLYEPGISEKVNLKDILSHKVGLGTFSGDILWYKSQLNSEQIIRRARHLPNKFEFRDGYGYSNLMFITAGEVLKKVSGKPWGEQVKERILKPLEMNRTTYRISEITTLGNYAVPHALVEGKNVAIPFTDWEEIAATGGLYSSVSDMSKWLVLHLQKGIHGKDTLLRPASYSQMWTMHNKFEVNHQDYGYFNVNYSGYGLGWVLRDFHGVMNASHTGGYDGMITSVSIFPDLNAGVIVLTNGLESPITAVSNYLNEALLGKPEKDWSKITLERQKQNKERDTRIKDKLAARAKDTKPSFPIQKYAGVYHTPVYGDITVTVQQEKLKIEFEHTPFLNAWLDHFHYDTWQLRWLNPSPWYTFGTLQFKVNAEMKVKGIEFDVPNDDFWFEELNADKKP
jgi:CubicO group peptidase (beta-lactamase class C family)